MPHFCNTRCMQSGEKSTLGAQSQSVEPNSGAADASPGASTTTKPCAPSESLTDAHDALTAALRTLGSRNLGRPFAVMAFGGFDGSILHSQLQSRECVASALQRLASVSSEDLRRCVAVFGKSSMDAVKVLDILACTIARPFLCARMCPNV
jgi:hypothetical protein